MGTGDLLWDFKLCTEYERPVTFTKDQQWWKKSKNNIFNIYPSILATKGQHILRLSESTLLDLIFRYYCKGSTHFCVALRRGRFDGLFKIRFQCMLMTILFSINTLTGKNTTIFINKFISSQILNQCCKNM